jgi:SOS response regulatory protein OraA/RecX
MISNQDVVGGKQLLDSLKRSGVDTQRIDRALGRYLGGTQALVIKMGIRRGVKYKLTERGISKAKELSGNLQ